MFFGHQELRLDKDTSMLKETGDKISCLVVNVTLELHIWAVGDGSRSNA